MPILLLGMMVGAAVWAIFGYFFHNQFILGAIVGGLVGAHWNLRRRMREWITPATSEVGELRADISELRRKVSKLENVFRHEPDLHPGLEKLAEPGHPQTQELRPAPETPPNVAPLVTPDFTAPKPEVRGAP